MVGIRFPQFIGLLHFFRWEVLEGWVFGVTNAMCHMVRRQMNSQNRDSSLVDKLPQLIYSICLQCGPPKVVELARLSVRFMAVINRVRWVSINQQFINQPAFIMHIPIWLTLEPPYKQQLHLLNRTRNSQIL
jgi:hypothetical protein